MENRLAVGVTNARHYPSTAQSEFLAPFTVELPYGFHLQAL